MYTTIYDQNGEVLTDGVQSQVACDATLNTARRLAQQRGEPVIVEDRGTEEIYSVNPDGSIGPGPEGWVIEPVDEDEPQDWGGDRNDDGNGSGEGE